MNPAILVLLNFVGLVLVYFLVRRSVLSRIERGVLRDRLARDVGELVATMNRSADETVTVLENRIQTARELSRRLEEVAGYLEQLPTSETLQRLPTPPETDDGNSARRPQDREPALQDSSDVRSQVLALNQEGLSAERISERLELPIGQVELIVALGTLGGQG